MNTTTSSDAAPQAPLVSLRQQARWLPADMDTPISLYLGMVGQQDGILLESAEVDGRWGMSAAAKGGWTCASRMHALPLLPFCRACLLWKACAA